MQRTSHMSSLFYCLPLAAAKMCIFIAENANITQDFIQVGGVGGIRVGKGAVGQSEVTATETGMPRNGDIQYSIIKLLTILLSIL